MLDLVLLATMFVVCGGIGLPVARLLPERFAWRVLVAPTLGYGMLAVAVPVAYKAGVSLRVFLYASIGIALALWAVYGRRLAREVGGVERRVVLAIGVGYAVAVVVMLAPRWSGGDRFSVFQGNLWDTYAYLQSGVVYARESYAFVAGADESVMRANPLISQAQTSLSNRPSVHELYGVFGNVWLRQAYRLHYPFLVFSLSQVVLVALFVLRGVGVTALRVAIPIACVVPLGFWGQYVLDINAWSQVASMPGLFLMFGLAIDIAARTETDVRAAARIAGVLAATVAGAFYLYPEGFVIYAAALGPLAAVPVGFRMVRARKFSLAAFVPLLGFLGVATLVLYAPMWDFMTGQVTRTGATKHAWWQYFSVFFHGRDAQVGAAPAAIADAGAAFFGLYFGTPAEGGVLALVVRGVLAITVVALLWGIVLGVRAASGELRRRLVAWIAAVLLMLAPAVVLFFDANYWPAGKIVSYAAPIYMTLACLAVAGVRQRGIRGIVGAFIAFQLACGVGRIAVARRARHYAAPYPAVQFPELKERFAWSLGKLERRLTPRTHVLLRTGDLWFTEHVSVFLYVRGIPFARAIPANTYFDSGKDLGVWQPPWVPDVEIREEPGAVVAEFRDGQPAIRIVAKR